MDQYNNDKQPDDTHEKSDKDSLNNEINNLMCYKNEYVNHNSDNKKGKDNKLMFNTTTICMNTNSSNSLSSTPHTAQTEPKTPT